MGSGVGPGGVADPAPEPAPEPAPAPGPTPGTGTSLASTIAQLTSYEGLCAVCGRVGRFQRDGRSMRETFPCPTCRASLRYRHQAEVLLAHYSTRGSASLEALCSEPRFAASTIFEPGIVGPFRSRLSALRGYVCSGYWADVAPGDRRDGVRCEDLEALSFGDESLDLILSSDILEHVRRPDRAFAETFRVLRPGRSHIFTVPFLFPLEEVTRPRVDVSGPHDVHLLEPVYHRNPLDPEGALVYNDFGLDLVGRLEDVGFHVRLPRGLHHTLTVVATRPGAGSTSDRMRRRRFGARFRS